ncbi:MAG TPA: sigma-70 family RNA polymerase sigma factor [Usitatibacteraceae bacterium]
MFAFLQSRLGLDEFHQVLSKRSGRWYNACLRITRDAQLAEDAVQDALLKAWGQRDKFRGAADLDTWIHRIALNAAIDLLRRRHPVADEEADPDLHAAPAQNSPEQHFTRQALNGDLSLAMQRLTAMERECFVLKHLEGWRLDEIADRQGSTVNNTKQALFRAVRKLRADMNVWRGE